MKKTLIIIFCTIVCMFSVSAFFGGFKAYGSVRTLKSEKSYSIKTIGGELLFGSTEKNSGFGIEGSLGVSTMVPQWRSSCWWWGSRETVYVYSIRTGLCWGHSFGNLCLHANAHASWDSVAFQKGTVQEWDRFSFHTLGIGCGVNVSAGLSARCSSKTSISIGVSRDWGLWSMTASRRRSNWDTSAVHTEWIEASVTDWRFSVGFLTDM